MTAVCPKVQWNGCYARAFERSCAPSGKAVHLIEVPETNV